MSKSSYILHKIRRSHSHLIRDPESAYYDDFGGGFAPSEVIVKCRSRIQDQMAVAVAVAVDFCSENKNLLTTSSYLLRKIKFLFHVVFFNFFFRLILSWGVGGSAAAAQPSHQIVNS